MTEPRTPPRRETGAILFLDEERATEILDLLSPHSRPLRSLRNRLEHIRAGHDTVWVLHTLFRYGDPEFDPREAGMGRDHEVPVDRLLLLRGSADTWDDAELLLALVYRREHRVGRRVVPPHVERVMVGEPARLVGAQGFLLEVEQQLFCPMLRASPWVNRAFPYRPQEPGLVTCVESCLWMAFSYLHRHAAQRRVSMAEVLAARPEHRVARGRQFQEVSAIISHAGYRPWFAVLDRRGHGDNATPATPELRDLPGEASLLTQTGFVEAMHACLDSQFPVILVLNRLPRLDDANGHPVGIDHTAPPALHSVVVVGHTVYASERRRSSDGQREASHIALRYRTTTEYLHEFIVHDDDVGPYMRLEVDGQGCADFKDPSSLYLESIAKSAHSMFVLMPQEVRMQPDQVMSMASDFLYSSQFAVIHQKYVEEQRGREGGRLAGWHFQSFDEYVQAHAERGLVLSFYLDSSARLRRHVREAFDAGAFDQATLDVYLGEPLPPFVWVVEITTLARAERDGAAAQRLGELVFDATVQPRDPPDDALIFARLPGLIARNDGELHLHFSSALDHENWLLRNFAPQPSA